MCLGITREMAQFFMIQCTRKKRHREDRRSLEMLIMIKWRIQDRDGIDDYENVGQKPTQTNECVCHQGLKNASKAIRTHVVLSQGYCRS